MLPSESIESRITLHVSRAVLSCGTLDDEQESALQIGIVIVMT